MKRVLYALMAATILSGAAAAYSLHAKTSNAATVSGR